MPRAGELVYYDRIGEAGRQHAVSKPFTDAYCGTNLQRVGALFTLLPAPPARILECGCGSGWLAYFLARHGYQVTGTDVAADAIRLAKDNPTFRDGPLPRFLVADSEQLEFDAEFDAVVFFDSLHHSVDEKAALRSAYRALRPGGICIALEPGRGHHRKSLDVEATYEVTEKDMPPNYVWRLARQVGFASCRMLPEPQYVSCVLYDEHDPKSGWRRKLATWGPMRYLAMLGIMSLRGWKCGITVLKKAST